MKKLLFGIFAHPDDEAFGPGGTLLKLKSEGYDIHLILLTDGDAGVNIDNVTDLASTRIAEWQKSAAILGTSSTSALHYPDGQLDLADSSEISQKVNEIIGDTLAKYDTSIEYSLMTLEPNGLTGHRDHIVASKIATEIAQQNKDVTVWYFCLDKSQAPLEETPYYAPQAREDSYITDKIDISPWLNDKYRLMDAHLSQRNDAASVKKLDHRVENFHVETY